MRKGEIKNKKDHQIKRPNVNGKNIREKLTEEKKKGHDVMITAK